MTRLCGNISRSSAAMNKSAAMLAAIPRHTVRMGQLTACMTS